MTSRVSDAVGRVRSHLTHPARLVPLAFVGVILAGAAVLTLPISRTGIGTAPPGLAALFTAVSATCVTGLSTVDVSTYWTSFGHVVILLLIQAGGFGIMTVATLLSLIVRGRLGLRETLVAQAESHTLNIGDVGRVLRRVALTMMLVESAVAVALTMRFLFGYQMGPGSSAWHGLFHSVSAFNNAGFSLNSDSLVRFVSDGWICLPICLAIAIGGIGYPVIFELRKVWRHPGSWSMHARLTVWGSLILFLVGAVGFAIFESGNPATLGPLDAGGRTVASITGSVMPRTAGFNSVDYGQMTSESMAMYYILMFIGGGSAGTAGGIKVATFFMLGFVILAEIRAERDVTIGRRAVPVSTQRQALTVSLLGVGAVFAGTIAMVVASDLPLHTVVFEVISAFGTVGVSAGITSSLPPTAQFVIMSLMFVGRVGTVTAASALALRSNKRRYQLPEESPLVG